MICPGCGFREEMPCVGLCRTCLTEHRRTERKVVPMSDDHNSEADELLDAVDRAFGTPERKPDEKSPDADADADALKSAIDRALGQTKESNR